VYRDSWKVRRSWISRVFGMWEPIDVPKRLTGLRDFVTLAISAWIW
jgi:hypothetical protein